MAMATVGLLEGHHKAAIALNNTAVSLLARGRYSGSLATFKDAIKFMGNVTAPAEVRSAAEEITGEEIRLALYHAGKRTSLGGISNSAGELKNGPVLKIVSSQCNTASIYAALTSCTHSTSRHVAFPMTIDLIDFEGCEDEDSDFHSGVILYNYGIASECLASTTTPSNNASVREIHVNAHRIFKMASALLTELYQNDWDNTPTYFASKLLLLKTFLTHGLIQTSIKLDLQSEYEEHCKTMDGLLRVMGAQQLKLPVVDHCLAAAA
jgi:hypothetical protein